jgi:crotonobetainyl-CoA:carnitine CoA-transferase CaiB-like acyl-CoA transferase
MELPLTGLKVVALEQAIAAPLCTRYLADMGADVIKIEKPDGGDFARQYDSSAGPEASSWFVWTNRGKRSLALDMKLAESQEIVFKLLARCDVFIQNLAPGAAARLGFDHARLHQKFPRLITVSISGYGLSGPYRDRKAYDLLLQGEAGVFALTGTPEMPMKAGISVTDIAAGLYSFSSILLALRHRDKTGEGNHIETSLLEATAEWVAPYLYYTMYTGNAPKRSGGRHNLIVPYGVYRAKNGSVNLAVQNEEQWRRLCRVTLSRPDIADDARYNSNEKRVAIREELDAIIEEIFSDFEVEELEQLLEAADVPFGRVNELEQVAQHPQLRAREKFGTLQGPDGRILEALVAPFGLVGLPDQMKPVPALGQHNEEIMRELLS